MAVGFVASSGEFPDPVTRAVWLVQVPVVATLARHVLRRDR
jgi:hypothetical protein